MTRESLYKEIENQMLTAYKGRREHHHEINTGVPKVYILETAPNLDEASFFDIIANELSNVFNSKEIKYFDDRTLLEFRYKDSDYYFDPYFFANVPDALLRFVPVFTFTHSEHSDSFIKQLVGNSFFFDNQWIQYKDVPKANIRAIDSQFTGEYSIDSEDIKVSFESSSAKKREAFLKDIIQKKYLGFFNSYKYYIVNDSAEYPFHALYYSNGKVTLYGDGFEKAREIISQVAKTYSESLEDIENHAKNLDGVYVLFQKNISNSEELLSLILNDPDSKLIAFSIFGSREYSRLFAADSHVGGVVELIISNKVMRITIGQNSCANTVRRILTILKRKFDPYIKVTMEF